METTLEQQLTLEQMRRAYLTVANALTRALLDENSTFDYEQRLICEEALRHGSVFAKRIDGKLQVIPLEQVKRARGEA